jgi:hypothetical protein
MKTLFLMAILAYQLPTASITTAKQITVLSASGKRGKDEY